MKFGSIRFDDVITQAEKTTFLYLSVRHARVRVLFFHRFGRSLVQTIGFVDTFWTLFYFFKKRFLELAKSGEHGYFCISPADLPDYFSGFYYLFSDRRLVTDVPFLSVELCRS